MPHLKPIVEVCVDSINSALIAQSQGAYRVEFCDNLSEGGTTPSFGMLEIARQKLTLKLYVLIRPRGGDFLYDDLEFEVMTSDIHYCGKIGCDGVVIGMLNADGTIDTVRCAELIRIAKSYNMGVTFHRAFDRCKDMQASLETIIDLGCERVLTSGGQLTAFDGIPALRKLIEQAAGRITIMPGAGVTPENAAEILNETGATEIHGTLRTRQYSAMTYKHPVLNNPEQELGLWVADAEKIKQIIAL
ncbi:MAG: copper homeostasis protein CutC [Bacteroidales bacterium]|jgi:copper homeostasis protein|nr:copper homeostasis protein CutC [Bacteroidales bacterium]